MSVLGHVDHGKSSLLDAIRGSNIVSGEAGAITQAIGASIIPMRTIRQRLGSLADNLGVKLSLPGLLFIDTPGHAAFTSLRSRGGNLADIAVLVVDINEGFKPQTIEAIEILKNAKTPFIVAANKVDLIGGFTFDENEPLMSAINKLQPHVMQKFDTKIYELVGQFYEKFSMQTERFDRIDDYTKQIAIIPCSAKAGIGLKEVLMVLSVLAQRFLENSLNVDVNGPGKGVILEVKEDKGLGKTIDVILYDGSIKRSDTIVYGTLDVPKSTKIRALFEPKANVEMRDKKGKFGAVKEVFAATGVKISAPDLDGAAAGMPVLVCDPKHVSETIEEVKGEISSVQVDTDDEGIIIKADTLGSLEALIQLLREKDIPIRKATVGQISKKDISEAESMYDKNPLYSVIVGFNITDVESTSTVKIITNSVIYKVLDDLLLWIDEQKKAQEAKELDNVIRPCKIEVLQNCIFRQSNPCIAGVEVIKGTLRSQMPLMKEDGSFLTTVKAIQAEKESVTFAEKGRQVAASFPNVTFGRQLQEMEFLYSDINEEEFRKLKELRSFLEKDEVEALKEIALIKREHNPVWGV